MNPSTLSFYLPLFISQPSSSSSVSTPSEPPAPLPNVTLANPLPIPGNQTLAQIAHHNATVTGNWQELDKRFRKSLPDEWFAKRLVYRGLIMRCCPGLEMLDGVVVEDGEKKKALGLLDAAGRGAV
jgi:hypothetical protein